MPANLILIIVIESIAVLVLGVLFIYKSAKLSKLINENNQLRKNDANSIDKQKEHDDVLAMIVHELRSPLAVMKGAADLMLKDAHNLSSEQISTLLAQIESSSAGMLKIVNDILDMSKLEAGKFEVTKKFTNINTVLEEECKYYQAMANEKQLQLTCQLDNSIPSFNFDADRIRQVLNNLISNAIKFTPEQGIVTITSKKDQANVLVSVNDSAEGISDDMKHKLFHKFVQLNNHQHTKEKGTGLGLVISKGIVEAHLGKIWIEDNKPKGSRFVFTLPLN